VSHIAIEPACRKRKRGNEHDDRASDPDQALGCPQDADIVLDVFEHVIRNETGVISWRGAENIEIVYTDPTIAGEPLSEDGQPGRIAFGHPDPLQPVVKPCLGITTKAATQFDRVIAQERRCKAGQPGVVANGRS
jgi:hypothetical protein